MCLACRFLHRLVGYSKLWLTLEPVYCGKTLFVVVAALLHGNIIFDVYYKQTIGLSSLSIPI